MSKIMRIAPLLGVLALAACGGSEQDLGADDRAEPNLPPPPTTQVTAAPAATPVSEAIAPDPGHKVIDVQMTMQGDKGVYVPAKFAATRGDVIRFVNGENVHNVHFTAANNPSGVNYPPASPYLTQPGQTYDLKVEFPAGKYDFVCDPHAASGMVGELTVTG